MNKTFNYHPTEEGKSEYLTRMARVVDSIQNGTVLPELGDSYKNVMTKEEKKELLDYVFSIMVPIIREEGLYHINKYGLKDMEESYMNQLYWDVWKNFYKYNNPLYKPTEGECAFCTFVKIFTKDPARQEFNSANRDSKYYGMKTHIIARTKRYIWNNLGLAEINITPELVKEFMPRVSSVNLTLEDITKTMEYMKGERFTEDIINDILYADEMEEVYIESFQVAEAFKQFMKKLRPLQQFIFCQNYGFCSDKYDDISLNQLACDLDFLKLVKEDHIGAKHLVRGDMRIEEPRFNGFERKSEPIILTNVEFIDANFITHQRSRCNDMIVAFVHENDFDEYDVLSSLVPLLKEAWAELSEQYGLE